MRCYLSYFSILGRTTVALAALFGVADRATAASQVATLSGDFAATHRADDLFVAALGTDLPPTMDVSGDQAAIYSDELRIIDRHTGAVLDTLGAPTAYFSQSLSGVWNNFTTFDPDGQSVWVGFGTGGNSDDRIFHVTQQDGTWQWNHVATLKGNFEMVFSGGKAYATANPGGMGVGNDTVYLLDTSMPGGVAATTHQAVAVVNGYSAGLAFDAAGNLYTATSNFGEDYVSSGSLYKFKAADVDSAITTGDTLSLTDAVKLGTLTSGASDTEVDSAGHVFVSVTQWGGTNSLVQWDGEHTGDGDNFLTVAIGSRPADDGNYFTFVKTIGDFATDGTLYMGDAPFGVPPAIVGITRVPEPSSALLAAIASLAIWFRWRRR